MSIDRLDSLGERLVWALKDSGLTQANVAERIGATQGAISQWCTGKKAPSSESLETLSRAIGVNAGWLEHGIGAVRSMPVGLGAESDASSAYWGFRAAPRDGGRDFGNANVWSFDPTMDVLVREVLQNALDAALPGGAPVGVKFKIIELRGGDLNTYLESLQWGELKRHVAASTENKQKLGSLLQDGLDYLAESGELLLLVVEDCGTTGLLGPETGDGKFAALCRNNLDSNKEGAATKGGAFGLGKGVLWRASRLATVMFCSNLSQPVDGRNRHLRLLGRCDLPWHELPGEAFAGPGWFGRPTGDERDYAASFWENEPLANALFLSRNNVGTGTSACVVGFHDPSSDKPKSGRELASEIERAAALHFFPAMARGQLGVSVETYAGRDEYDRGAPSWTAEVDARSLQPEFSHVLQVFREGAFADVLTAPGDVVCKRVTLTVPHRRAPQRHDECVHEALLLVRYASDDCDTAPNRLAIFRGPGMVVSEQNLSGICLGSRPFHALLLCGLAATNEAVPADMAAEEFLRTSEPPSHNKWMATPELKAAYARGCISKLNNFLDAAKEMLRDVVKPTSRDLGDGPNSLRELFRIGPEPLNVARERPRVVEQHGTVDEQGRWNVEARIRLKAADRETVITPAVVFLAETGGGSPVRWEVLEAVNNCEAAEGYSLRVPPRKREISFRGRTDPTSHPVPARDSSVIVDIRRVVQTAGAKS